MMKTPEEIKKGLEVCGENAECGQCPYFHSHAVDEKCVGILLADALACIRQLERERDAAVQDLKSVVASNYFDGDFCKLCKYNEPDGQCHHHCIPYSIEWGWEWRGVQEME